jgi:hypothetical protein
MFFLFRFGIFCAQGIMGKVQVTIIFSTVNLTTGGPSILSALKPVEDFFGYQLTATQLTE